MLFKCDSCANTLAVPLRSMIFRDEYFTMQELADTMGITRQGVYFLSKKGLLKTSIVNGKKRFHYQDFIEFSKSRKNIKDERYKFKS